jgi:lipopolysaccharide export system protein LptA
MMKNRIRALSHIGLLAIAILFANAAYAAPKNPASDGGVKQSEAVNTSAKKSELGEKLRFSGDEKDLPLYVKSDTLTLDSKARVFTYRGNVEATKGSLVITSDVMIGQYDEDSRIQTITAIGNVVITKGETMQAKSNRAVYNVAQARIELTEGPEIIQQGNALSADKVTLYVDEDRSEAEGEVRVKVLKGVDPISAANSAGAPAEQKGK